MTIQPGLRSVLTSSAHELDDFFGSELIAFTKSNGNVTSSTQQYLVYCQSVHGLVEYVKGRRNIQDAILLVGIDGGQGSLKFILSIEDKQETNQPEYKYTGVKRCFILALVHNVQENYENVAKIWRKLDLGMLKITVTGKI